MLTVGYRLQIRDAHSGGMRQQEDRQRLWIFGKEDVAVLLLTSVAGIVLPPRGSLQSLAHTLLPCSVEECVHLLQLLTYILHWYLQSVFTIVSLHNVKRCSCVFVDKQVVHVILL